MTVIELMVVVVTVGTLLAIAVPTFVGSQSRADDAAARSSLRTALTAADVLVTVGGSFAAADFRALSRDAGSLTYVDRDVTSAGPGSVSVSATRDLWAAAAQSGSGTCFLIAADRLGRVRYGARDDGRCDGHTAAAGARADSW